MYKKEARKIFREKRKAINATQQAKWDDLILIRFQMLNLPFIENVFSYIAIEEKKEINTTNILRYLQFLNPQMQIAYPVSDFSNCSMKAIVPERDEFRENSYGILEPVGDEELPVSEIDLVLVPLLCFDKEGYRVGYGKGFYDKFLSASVDKAIKIGLSYFEPVDTITDRDEFDVPLNYCITPDMIYEF